MDTPSPNPETKKPICIWHKGCLDGFTSAWVVNRFAPDLYEFHEGVYNEEPPDVTDRHVVMVDFSYPEDVIAAMEAKASSVLILDHHKTAEAALQRWIRPLDDSLWGFPPKDGECWAYFDMNRSGAGLVWDFFFPMVPRPRMVGFVEDRDLWHFHLLGSREVAAVMYAHDMDFVTWEYLMLEIEDEQGLLRILNKGDSIIMAEAKQRRSLMHETLRTMKIGGILMPVCNAPYMWASEMGNEMSKDAGNPAMAGATYYDRSDGMRQFSLRSVEGGPDVSAIAKRYGGGGHMHAAGFTAPYRGWEGEG